MVSRQSWWRGVRRDQWLVLVVAWHGWVFDAMDATIYTIVLHPALHELLHTSSGRPTAEHIGWYGGIIFSIFLIGWAIGGITFGVVADRFGRTKILIATILMYAVFTGAAPCHRSGGIWRSTAFSRHWESAESGPQERPLSRNRGRKTNGPRRQEFYSPPGPWDFFWRPSAILS
jgi:hypothetical protein